VPEPTILLVEDNEDDVFAFKWSARRAEVTCPLQVVTDGRQALAYLSGEGEYADRLKYPVPSLMFLDLKLPYLNGTEILAWKAGQVHLSDIPVIVLSGSDERKDRETTLPLGARDYIVKPVEPAKLRSVVDETLSRRPPSSTAYVS